MNLKPPSRVKHPPKIVSVVYFDGPTISNGKARHLTGYGAFEVTIEIPLEPIFKRHHATTWDNQGRYGLLGDLGALSDGIHVVVGSSDPYITFWDGKHVLQAGADYIDALRELNGPQPTGMTLISKRERSLTRLSNMLGLPECNETALLGQARCADDRAQLMWLAYANVVTSSYERRALFAAYQAWRAVENARLIRF